MSTSTTINKLHWHPGQLPSLLTATGDTAAAYWAYGNSYEWLVMKNIDPKDQTRGTSKSVAAARKAIEKAVTKLGFEVVPS